MSLLHSQSRSRLRRKFLYQAVVLEAVLVALALVIAYFVGLDVWAGMVSDLSAWGWGVAGAAPLFLLFMLLSRLPYAPLVRINEFLITLLGPLLASCGIWHLLGLAALVGFAEELLFRGVIQTAIASAWGEGAGLLLSNILFGLVHAVTLLYGILAGLIGIYLGLLLGIMGEPNLLIPMVSHGVYDFLAFIVVARLWRVRQGGE